MHYKSSLTYADVIPSWYNDTPHSKHDRAPAAEMRRARVMEARAVRSGRALERCLHSWRRDTYNDMMAMLLLKSLQYKLATPAKKFTTKLSEEHLYTRYIRPEEVYEDMNWEPRIAGVRWKQVVCYRRVIDRAQLFDERWWPEIVRSGTRHLDHDYLYNMLGFEYETLHLALSLERPTYDIEDKLTHLSFQFHLATSVTVDVFFRRGSPGSECLILNTFTERTSAIPFHEHPLRSTGTSDENTYVFVELAPLECLTSYFDALVAHQFVKCTTTLLRLVPNHVFKEGSAARRVFRPEWLLSDVNQEPQEGPFAREMKCLMATPAHRTKRFDTKVGLPFVLETV